MESFLLNLVLCFTCQHEQLQLHMIDIELHLFNTLQTEHVDLGA